MQSLPIDEFLPKAVELLRAHSALVLVAEPGAGKTTRVPPAIVRAADLLSKDHDKLVLLQPRRVAARASAARIADESQTAVGGDFVGYHVRLDKCVSSRTKIRVLTEGILTRQLVDDPSAEGIGCVVLDEFHERSIDADVALALLREIQNSLRPDLKIVVMSATIAADEVSRYLNDAPILHVPGRTFPIAIEHRTPNQMDFVDRCVHEAAEHLQSATSDGDVLVFLPGVREINDAAGLMDRRLPDQVDVRVLHGSLKLEEQRRALEPREHLPRCIFATNIAETSLTIDGVDCVIDSGYARVARFDKDRGLDRLEMERISKASATQRAGRAGRTRPGKCVRLWSAIEHNSLEEFDEPEIFRVDLAGVVLALAAFGESRPLEFGWFEPPEKEVVKQAQQVLSLLGLIDEEGRITRVGEHAARLPVHPRVAKLLMVAMANNLVEDGCSVASILSERDFVSSDSRVPRVVGQSDVLWRMQLMQSRSREHFINPVAMNLVQQTFRQLRDLCDRDLADDVRADLPMIQGQGDERLMKLMLMGWPDRLCKRRTGDVAAGVMVGQIGVRLDPSSIVREGAMYLALDVRGDARSRKGEATVAMASRVEEEWLSELLPKHFSTRESVEVDSATGKAVGVRQKLFAGLVIAEARGVSVSGESLKDAVKTSAVAMAEELMKDNEAVQGLIARLDFCKKHVAELNWPEVTAREVVEIAATGASHLEQVRQRLFDAAMSLLVYPLDRKLIELAPQTIEVPTGSEIKLDYSGEVPVLAVRLQELFGLADTPKIAGGRVKVLLHLLGPNYRPVQVTSDLSSFWKNTYSQVRKDLRARYPKHSWPDDPLTAPAVRGARRRR
jgi:ATP-dependent helicase HrpB